MAIVITEDWTIELGIDTDTGLNKRLVVDTPVIQVPRQEVTTPKIVVHLREQLYNATSGIVVEDKTEGYQLVRGQEHKHFDGSQMQEKDDLGNLVFEADGTTPVMGRTQAYERTIYALENGLFNKQQLLDGIKEYYKIV
jgi:hypothetical protein